MCNNCGCNNCGCNKPHTYSFNWNSIEDYPCDPCNKIKKCKKHIPAPCVTYTGTLGTMSVEQAIDTIVSNMSNIQNTDKIALIAVALNDINARLNAIEGGSHPNYTI